jgi:nicotinamidase/pyrazinamidase
LKLEPTDALVVVDVQRDFCPGGRLPVAEGDRVARALRPTIELFDRLGLPIFFTRDWHPPDHSSFRERGGPWPVHCVAGTEGAAFHPDLPVPASAVVISKAVAPDEEAYSGFQSRRLEEELRRRGARRILVGGLATDYCVRATVLDGLRAGFRAAVLEDAVAAVDVKPGDGARALREMRDAGAAAARFEDLDAPEGPLPAGGTERAHPRR